MTTTHPDTGRVLDADGKDLLAALRALNEEPS